MRHLLCVSAAAGLLLAATISSAASAQSKRGAGLRIEATFIQYQTWMMGLTPQQWHRELDALYRAGIRTIILQRLQAGSTSFLPQSPHAPDATRIILDYAVHRHMHVFLGLAEDEGWWRSLLDPDYLARLRQTNIRLAQSLWQRYGRSPAFAGWYIPQEPWDVHAQEDQIIALAAYFADVASACRALSSRKPVAIAPFFSSILPPERFQTLYTQLLARASVDVVMLQDGVGARGWDRDLEARIVPYFAAMRHACTANGCELWSDLEIFHNSGNRFVPTNVGRIERQMAAEAPFVSCIAAFDAFHYLSPFRGAAQRSLYTAYLNAVVRKPFLPIYGRSVEIDPTFAYYRGRSAQSIANEIRANGYSTVHIILTADSFASLPLLHAFHRQGMGTWYATFINGTYSTKDLPRGWQEWRMVTRSDLEGRPLADGFTRLCLNNPGYRAWKKRQITHILAAYPFQGVDLMEPHWPDYPGPSSPAYGCFCKHCRAAFHRMFPEETSLPDILHPQSPNSPQNNPKLWQEWLSFRRASLTQFLNDLVNGTEGIRRKTPAAKVCVWTLALAGTDGMRSVKEDTGEDAAAIARTVRPDLYCFQTHWPDWTRAGLPPDYVTQYEPYIQAVRSVAPLLPMMIQADIGSQRQNRHGWHWIHAFEDACLAMGVTSTTLYEYSIGGYMYTDAPAILQARREGNTIRLVCNKRLDPASVLPAAFRISKGRVLSSALDGSTVILHVDAPMEPLSLTAGPLRDDASLRLFHDDPSMIQPEQTVGVASPVRCTN
ncbi:MAG: DUF4434 domain-containing protein [Chthonomonadales bacterium]